MSSYPSHYWKFVISRIHMFLFILFLGCGDKSMYNCTIKLSRFMNLQTIENAFIIPWSGCGACNHASFEILNSNIDFSRTGLIFTRYDDKKLVKNLFLRKSF